MILSERVSVSGMQTHTLYVHGNDTIHLTRCLGSVISRVFMDNDLTHEEQRLKFLNELGDDVVNPLEGMK